LRSHGATLLAMVSVEPIAALEVSAASLLARAKL